MPTTKILPSEFYKYQMITNENLLTTLRIVNEYLAANCIQMAKIKMGSNFLKPFMYCLGVDGPNRTPSAYKEAKINFCAGVVIFY